jgi:hypothetical protein
MLPSGGISRMPATREQRCSLHAGSPNLIPITTGEADSLCHPLHLRIFLSAPPVLRHPCRANKKGRPQTGPALYFHALCAYTFGFGPASGAALLLRRLPLLPKNIRTMNIFYCKCINMSSGAPLGGIDEYIFFGHSPPYGKH